MTEVEEKAPPTMTVVIAPTVALGQQAMTNAGNDPNDASFVYFTNPNQEFTLRHGKDSISSVISAGREHLGFPINLEGCVIDLGFTPTEIPLGDPIPPTKEGEESTGKSAYELIGTEEARGYTDEAGLEGEQRTVAGVSNLETTEQQAPVEEPHKRGRRKSTE